MSKWFEKSDAHGDIAISTRVRLARNLKDYPFPGRLSSEQAQEIVDAVSDYLTKDIGAGKFEAVDLAGSQKLDVMAMMERHLISPEFAEGGKQ